MQILPAIKSLTRHSAIYTVSTMIQRAQGLIMLPILTDTSYLATKSLFGNYVLIYTFIAFMNVLYLYGIDSAFMRYFFLGQHKRKDIYHTAIRLLTLSGLITSGIILIYANPLSVWIFGESGYAFFVQIAAAILFFDTLANIPYLILRAEEKSMAYTAIRIGRFLLELILNIVFVVILKTGVKGVLYANLIAAIVNLLFLIPFQIKYIRGSFSYAAMKDLLLFGLPMIPNGLAYLVVEMSDRYLMLYLLDKDILAVYAANYKFGTLMLFLVTAFRTAWQPFFLKIVNDDQAKQVYARVMTYYILGASFIVLYGGYLIEFIVRLPIYPGKTLLGREYWGGTFIIPIILLSYMLYGVYVNLTVGVYVKKRSRWMGVFTGLAALTNIASNFYLMPNFGMMGAAIATLLAYLVMAGAIFILNQRIYPIHYEYYRIGMILLYLSGALLLFYQLAPGPLVRICVLAGFPVMIIVTGFFNQEERAVMHRLLARIRTPHGRQKI